MEFLCWFIFWGVVGYLVGRSRGQEASGIIWSLLLGPFGVLIVLCLPNRIKIEKERVTTHFLQQQVALQKAQLEMAQARVSAVPQGFPKATSIRLAKGAEDLGEKDVASVKLMLKSGAQASEYFFFDQSSQEWEPLTSHPDFAAY